MNLKELQIEIRILRTEIYQDDNAPVYLYDKICEIDNEFDNIIG